MTPIDATRQHAPGLTQFGSDGVSTFRMEFAHGVVHEYTTGDPDGLVKVMQAHKQPMAYWASKIRGRYHFKVVT